MKYQITFWKDSVVVDIMEVGTAKGNIPDWAVKTIQQLVAKGCRVEIEQPRQGSD